LTIDGFALLERQLLAEWNGEIEIRTYVLILMPFFNGADIEMHEFPSEAACIRAGKFAQGYTKENWLDPLAYAPQKDQIDYICVGKGKAT
jgi:hypothetical protein